MPRVAAVKDGGDGVGLTKRGRGVNILAMVDRDGLPPFPCGHMRPISMRARWSNGSLDCSMLEAKLEALTVLTWDQASDRDRLDEELKQDGGALMAPQRSPDTLKAHDGHLLQRATMSLDRGTVLGLAPMKAAPPDSLGRRRPQLPGVCTTRLQHRAP